MSLDLPRVLPQVEAMSRAAAERAAGARDRLQLCSRLLDCAAAMPAEEMRRRIARAGTRWPGALPSEEPINAVFEAPELPPRFDVIAADGSQVYPDRHGLALYYLINVGSIVIGRGSGQAPQVNTEPLLAFDDEALYGPGEGLISPALIDGRRDVAELAALARLSEHRSEKAPTLALLDNGLLLWLALQVEHADSKRVEDLLRDYLRQMEALRANGAALAGFIDRPRTANVLALLHLASLEESQLGEASLEQAPYRGLTDRSLFALRLQPGQRSARFTHASPVNTRFQQAGHSIQFFYLHCGGGDTIARVEVPQWVGESEELLFLVHAGILEQCRSMGGFPYALARAHELAVVTHDDRQAFEQMLSAALLRRGLITGPSRKALTKQWTAGRRRHHL